MPRRAHRPPSDAHAGAHARRATVRAVVASALAGAVLVATVGARAEGLEGKWRQGPLREDFTVQQWLNGCGPAPKSSSTGGGEIVTVRAEGDELAFIGGGRVYRTNQCYDPMPTLARETHQRQADGKTWRTRCKTPENDPREAILNTLVVATSDKHIDLVETGRYEIVLESGRCIADVKRTRSYDLVTDAPETPSTATAPAATTAKPPPEPRPSVCADPGEPSRLEVRPSQKLLRTGEAFQFRAVVLDAKGCATHTPTTWALADGATNKGVTVDAKGNVAVAGDAPEGTVTLVATAAGKDARVEVQVSQPAHYDELLARSGLNASGESDQASVTTIGSQSIGAGEGRVDDRARTRRLVFVAIVGGVLLVLGAVAVALSRRSRRAAALEREAEARHDARVREVLERRRARADAHAAAVRAHEESIAAAQAAASAPDEASAPPPPPPAPREERVCPSCGREYAAPTSFCAHDGARLVSAEKAAAIAYPAAAAMAKSASRRGKICPTCGERFDGGAEFCGKDGTQLVLLN